MEAGRRVVLETGRLRLRHFVVEDAPFILRLLNEPDFLRFIGDRGVGDLDEARTYVERVPLESYRSLGFGLYLVELRSEGSGGSEASGGAGASGRTPVGMCGLMRKGWLDAPDLAYAFLAEHAGRGYASEAARAVLDHGRDDLGMERIVAVVQPENAASIRVLEKLGFAPAGTVTDPADGGELALYSTSGGLTPP